MRNYVDQAETWAQGKQFPWFFTQEVIDDATQAVLVLEPTS
ncbi:hypothetical protein [Enteractinococcus helveticum]|nr:hypothetical protein [Enteractinococcus helveticum]